MRCALFRRLPVLSLLAMLVTVMGLCLVSSWCSPAQAAARSPLAQNADKVYDNAVLSEDTTWRGRVLVKGSLVVPPQTTLRIEPGAVVLFEKQSSLGPLPRLVVMGRIQCNGAPERKIVLGPNYATAEPGDWGGVLLLASEKRNVIEECRIEGADVGIEAHFSNLTVKGVTIARCVNGLVMRDSILTLQGGALSECQVALEAQDSELDLRATTLNQNRRGMALARSSVTMTGLTVKGSELQGIACDECRIRMTSCTVSDNGVGLEVKGGEGQINLTRFTRNRSLGAHLSAARLKLQRCLFSDNQRDGLRMDDGRSLVWMSAFIGNNGNHLVNAGREPVTAVQNWWGTSDQQAIAAHLLDRARDAAVGPVRVFPWLTEPPPGLL